ncbi:hypothetical protein K469DRAFT_695274 [Zopfia rhizophila CBS 207.26]|uniref:Uncharacterized protein n=1 Tax=Zopfia rhizophila CBS 207.26 TaxID=1314779 RepID=A0A6A6DIJ4_9PEZI|nr:hypothetical protein K469DRAFT_695274 [Zopfia rhizophila CBS 207.26]
MSSLQAHTKLMFLRIKNTKSPNILLVERKSNYNKCLLRRALSLSINLNDLINNSTKEEKEDGDDNNNNNNNNENKNKKETSFSSSKNDNNNSDNKDYKDHSNTALKRATQLHA